MTLGLGYHPVAKGHVAVVVTYLEMTAAAQNPDKAFPTGIDLVQSKMSAAAYKDLFQRIGAPWLWESRLTMDDTTLQNILDNPNVETHVVTQSDKAIGLVELAFQEDDTCDLSYFGLIMTATGQGIGGPMIALAQQRAFARPIKCFRVNTCTLDAPNALKFYQQAGFVAQKTEVEIFEDPRLNGILPRTSAAYVPCLT